MLSCGYFFVYAAQFLRSAHDADFVAVLVHILGVLDMVGAFALYPAEANTKAQDVEKNAMTEISLAGKQALSKIKAEISSMIIAKSPAPAVKAATLDPEFVKQMLLTVAKNWSGADSSKNQLKALLPEAEQKAFEATFEAAAKELLAAGVEVGYSKEVRTGFKVGAKDGGYYISFSDQDFDALLKEYLRDKVYKMLYNA